MAEFDDGAAVPYDAPFTFSQRGEHTLTYWSADVAGNVESHDLGHTVTVRIDGTPPTIIGSRTRLRRRLMLISRKRSRAASGKTSAPIGMRRTISSATCWHAHAPGSDAGN